MMKFVGKATRFESEKIKMIAVVTMDVDFNDPEKEFQFCIGSDERTVYVSKSFREKAMLFGTIEAREMYELNVMYPTFVMKEII